jgi:hypothetical protein
MNLTAVVMGFQMEQGETLRGLVHKCGYSAPTTVAPTAKKMDPTHAASIEVERVGDMAYITVAVARPRHLEDAIQEVQQDLAAAGLIEL